MALVLGVIGVVSHAQVNTDQVINIGRNAMYFEDYVLSIQYFNQAIKAKPYLAVPYFYRAIAKINLDDYAGAEEDAAKAIELNPFLSDAWEVRGVARQNLGKDSLAILDYNHALELLPRNRQILFNKAMAQVEVRDYAGADSTFKVIIDYYPMFETAHLGLARMLLERQDTIGAIEGITRALELNPRSFNAYAMRADINLRRGRDMHPQARADIDSALRLQPRNAGLYVNRAYLKYINDDYTGAMQDYDHALELEPYHPLALYNRALLNTEVSAYDRALRDFDRVLQISHDDVRARYNRAQILGHKRQFARAIEDINYVINDSPDFPAGYYARASLYEKWGKKREATADRQRAESLSRKLRPDAYGRVKVDSAKIQELTPEEMVQRQFATLLTIDDNTDMPHEYNNTSIRGKVQDNNIPIELEPMVSLAYYSTPGELRSASLYIKEVTDLNDTRVLRSNVIVTDRVAPISDQETISNHFRSIEDYNSLLANSKPRAIDYIGRAMDFITVHNYQPAITDLTRAIAMSPTFGPAYMMRAQARMAEMAVAEHDDDVDYLTRQALQQSANDAIIEDLDKAISLMPRTPYLWFNRANIYAKSGNYEQAISDYNRALDLKSDYGPAYFNRGYCRLKLGDRQSAINDLSRAGEYGVVSAYNLLKRIRAPR